jgi:hypothetical protein
VGLREAVEQGEAVLLSDREREALAQRVKGGEVVARGLGLPLRVEGAVVAMAVRLREPEGLSVPVPLLLLLLAACAGKEGNRRSARAARRAPTGAPLPGARKKNRRKEKMARGMAARQLG